MQPTPAPPEVGLSFSRDGHCGWQDYAVTVLGIKKPETFIFARGHVAEAIVQAWWNNKKTGVNGLSLREAGLAEVEKRGKLMEHTELVELHQHFPQILEGVERYVESIDYGLVDMGHWFTLSVRGFTRPLRGQIDILGERTGEDVIIDIKYQMKPIPEKKFKTQKKEWQEQLALYALYYMSANKTLQAPRCENHVIVAGSEPQVFETVITEELLYKVLNDQHNLNVRMDTGYWPLNRESRLCDPRWCHVYALCHEQNFLPAKDLIDIIDVLD